MTAWPVLRMNELCEITSSKRIFASDYVSEGVPFYRGKEVTEKYKGNLDVSVELFITEEKFTEIERKFGAPKPGDLLLTSVGTLGSIYVVKPDDRFYFKDGNLTWFRNFRELDSRYLYYWLGSPQGKAELKKATIGSSQSAFTIVLLKRMEIHLPPLPEQKRIAGILSAYDELIENSQRRIKVLETMARNLYREWFVHYRYPGHENTPLSPSPLGDIPKGWEVKKLGEILELNYGKALKKEDRCDGQFPVYGSSGIVGTHDSKLVEGPGIIVGRKGNVGSVYWCDEDFYVIDTAYFVSSSLPLRFLLYVLPTLNFINSDAAVPGLSRNQAYTLEILVPPSALLTKFCALAEIFEGQVATLQRQIQNLRKTRDLLLPRLLSGQIPLHTPTTQAA
jgi:type I restriction enzyme S subunit